MAASSSDDEIQDAVEAAAFAARVNAQAWFYRPARLEAGLGQNIFVKQVVSIGAFISRSSHFICAYLTPEGAASSRRPAPGLP